MVLVANFHGRDYRMGQYIHIAANQWFRPSIEYIPGHTAQEMYSQRQEPRGLYHRSLSHSPDLVILWIGSNELNNYNPNDTHTERELGRLIVEIAALYTTANIPILILALPACRNPRPPLTFELYSTRVRRVNDAIQRALRNTNTFI